MTRRRLLAQAGVLGAAGATPWLLTACGGGDDRDFNRYAMTPLVANKASYKAKFTEPEFVNAWGIAIRPAGAGGHFWVGAGGISWQYVGDVRASADPALRTLFQDGLKKVGIPGADARTDSASAGKVTGVLYNGAPLDSALFRVRDQPAGGQLLDGSARFIFVTDSGHVTAWTERAPGGGVVRVDGPAMDMYDGSARGQMFFGAGIDERGWDRLWLADFGADPQIRTLNAQWQPVPTQGFANPFASGAGGRARPGDPVPFNIQMLGGKVYVAYAISKAKAGQPGVFDAGEEDTLDAAAEAKANFKPAKGKVAEFTPDGRLLRVLGDAGALNAPWGLAIAPKDFGALSGHLLVGNFGGAGRISAFDLATGQYLDDLRDTAGQRFAVQGMWGLQFGNGASLGDANALYFAAGPEDEKDGLFGVLRLD
ncbi:TIGR03118 family protein [Ottowia testudinis]|uniref:TIGR03118 family protein n=2 Tax=Ottowia testudinis TaxID=2816950 RepID=A0A975CKD2_9BURK|nr:TIGR03118 family protein [Ottowia testudinis]